MAQMLLCRHPVKLARSQEEATKMRPRRAARALATLAVLLAALPAAAQQKPLTLDDIYDPQRKVDFGRPATGLAWIDDRYFLWPRTDPQSQDTEWVKLDAQTGATQPLFEVAKLETALGALEGVTPEDAKRLARQRSYVTDESRSALVLTIGRDLYHYDLLSGRARRLTRAEGEEQEATVSPGSRQVAFVRANDLYTVAIPSENSPDVEPVERRLTTDGSSEILNGRLDWVYQEEVYGRGHYRAYWWSPDAQQLAFLRLDEKGVPRYTLVDDIPYRPEVEVYPYPKAGDPNPTVRLGIVPVGGGDVRWVDLGKYAGQEFLIVDVAWMPDGKRVTFQVQDREQTWLDLNVAEAATGAMRTVLRETTKAWVEPQGSPRWLEDGSFLWLSERSGFKHLYRHAADGTPLRALTEGRWEVRALHALDTRAGWVYFSGTERGARGLDVYRVRTSGGPPQRLSKAPGTHTALFNPGGSLYLDTFSNVQTPPQVRLHRADGQEVRVVDANPVPALQEYRLSKPEFLQVPTRDGFPMEAMLIRPPDFDPARKYPVYQHTYAGPHAPQVKDAWGGQTYLFHQLLAQQGVVVWICDNRTASGKGAESAWPLYKRFGESELRDIEDGVAWLRKQPWVDGARIGIGGWSFGGFMTAYALTHSTSFAMGIAGGSVTDWRDYDTIYTERYMRTPGNNPEGYRDTAPRAAAAKLQGELLLMHGAIDDNVHPQNTNQMAYELQKAGKPFRLMLYPKARHGVTDPALVKHLRAAMLAFIVETLLGR
jgi:dipeptidyl-peptidase-4